MPPLSKLPALPKFGKEPRPVLPRHPPVRPTGPRSLRLGSEPYHHGQGPGSPPAGWGAGGKTSKDEWPPFWGLMKLLDPERDPRQPPFIGGKTWQYQKTVAGGEGAGIQGTLNVDFVVQQAAQVIGFRVQSERWHVMADPAQLARDFFIKTHTRAINRIVDLYSQDYVGDPTGQAICAILAQALKGNERGNPTRFGTARRIRPRYQQETV